jgi:N-acetylglucosaminyl-diphospho-decaprenol L-rhamnosyltransferase
LFRAVLQPLWPEKPHPALISVSESSQDWPQDVTVLLVLFNSAACVPALAACLRDAPQVIAVDNASTDDCAVRLRAALPQVQGVRLERNVGFGAGNNAGMARVSTPYVLLLNPDCSIAAADVHRLRVWLLGEAQLAIAAPQILNPDGAGGWRPEAGHHMNEFAWKPRTALAEGPLCADFATAACWLARAEALRAVHGFDERFFLYYEDNDLCLRLRQAGWSILVEPTAQAFHLNGASSRDAAAATQPAAPQAPSPLRAFHTGRSRVLLYALHAGPAAALRLQRSEVWRRRINGWLYRLTGRGAKAAQSLARARGAAQAAVKLAPWRG